MVLVSFGIYSIHIIHYMCIIYIYTHWGRFAGITFPPADEDEFPEDEFPSGWGSMNINSINRGQVVVMTVTQVAQYLTYGTWRALPSMLSNHSLVSNADGSPEMNSLVSNPTTRWSRNRTRKRTIAPGTVCWDHLCLENATLEHDCRRSCSSNMATKKGVACVGDFLSSLTCRERWPSWESVAPDPLKFSLPTKTQVIPAIHQCLEILSKTQIPVTSTIFAACEEISSAMKGAEGYPPLVVKMISCSDATLMVLYDVFLLHVFSFIIQIMICYMIYIYTYIYIWSWYILWSTILLYI